MNTCSGSGRRAAGCRRRPSTASTGPRRCSCHALERVLPARVLANRVAKCAHQSAPRRDALPRWRLSKIPGSSRRLSAERPFTDSSIATVTAHPSQASGRGARSRPAPRSSTRWRSSRRSQRCSYSTRSSRAAQARDLDDRRHRSALTRDMQDLAVAAPVGDETDDMGVLALAQRPGRAHRARHLREHRARHRVRRRARGRGMAHEGDEVGAQPRHAPRPAEQERLGAAAPGRAVDPVGDAGRARDAPGSR